MADERNLNILIERYKEASRNGLFDEQMKVLNEIGEEFKDALEGTGVDINKIMPSNIDSLYNILMQPGKSENEENIINKDILKLSRFRKAIDEHIERATKISEVERYKLLKGKYREGTDDDNKKKITKLKKEINKREKFFKEYVNDFLDNDKHRPLDDELVKLFGKCVEETPIKKPTYRDIEAIDNLKDEIDNDSLSEDEKAKKEEKLKEKQEKLGEYWKIKLQIQKYERIINQLKKELETAPDEKKIDILQRIAGLEVELRNLYKEYAEILMSISEVICRIVDKEIKEGKDPVAPAPVAPAPVAPAPVAPTPAAHAPAAPAPVAPASVAPAPVAPTPAAHAPAVTAKKGILSKIKGGLDYSKQEKDDKKKLREAIESKRKEYKEALGLAGKPYDEEFNELLARDFEAYRERHKILGAIDKKLNFMKANFVKNNLVSRQPVNKIVDKIFKLNNHDKILEIINDIENASDAVKFENILRENTTVKVHRPVDPAALGTAAARPAPDTGAAAARPAPDTGTAAARPAPDTVASASKTSTYRSEYVGKPAARKDDLEKE